LMEYFRLPVVAYMDLPMLLSPIGSKRNEVER